MKKMLCLKNCIYAELAYVQNTSIFYTYTKTPNIKLIRYNCKFIKCNECFEKEKCSVWSYIERNLIKHTNVYCRFRHKNIGKFVTECENFCNTTLFTEPKKPEYPYLPPFTNDCEACKGKGFVVVQIPNVEQKFNHPPKERFEREKCCFCNGEGIIRKTRNLVK